MIDQEWHRIRVVMTVIGLALCLLSAGIEIGRWHERSRLQPIDPELCHIAGGQVIHTERGTLCSKGTT